MRKIILTLFIVVLSILIYACDDTTVPTEPIETIPTIILDTTAPVISGVEDLILTVGDAFDPEIGITASDDTDGNITNLISISGTYDISVAGTYQITYTVSDMAGNQTTLTRQLIVKLKSIDQAILNWNNALSYTMNILFESGEESYLMIVEISQAYMKIDVLDEIIYYEIDGETCYIYEIEQFVWQKNVVNCSEKGTTELQFLSSFSSEYFVEQTIDDVKTYVLKMEYYSSLQSFLGSTITSNFRMTLSDDQIDQVSFTMTRNSILFDMTISLSQFNETVVTLPEVTIS